MEGMDMNLLATMLLVVALGASACAGGADGAQGLTAPAATESAPSEDTTEDTTEDEQAPPASDTGVAAAAASKDVATAGDCTLVNRQDVIDTFGVDLGEGVQADNGDCEFQQQTPEGYPQYVVVQVDPTSGPGAFDNLVESMESGGFPVEEVQGLGDEAYILVAQLVAVDREYQIELQYAGAGGITDNHDAAIALAGLVLDRANGDV